MSVRDITPEQIAAADRFIAGPAGGDPRRARTRQICTVAQMLIYCDILITEAAEARIAAPGLLELRDWLVFNLDQNACAAAPPLNVKPDLIKDAVAASVVAARSGKPDRYAAARVAEANARVQTAKEAGR